MSYDYHKDGSITIPSWEQQNYGQYCFNRLPCGYCRLLNAPCPIMADGEAKEAYIDARAEANTMPTIILASEEGE